MRTAHEIDSSTRLILVLATLAALATGIVYLVIALGLVIEDFQSPPRPVMLLAGVIYVVGAGLLHIVDRRLLLLGAAANSVVLAIFVLSAARGSATVDAVTLIGKAAQVTLSALLLWAGSVRDRAVRCSGGCHPTRTVPRPCALRLIVHVGRFRPRLIRLADAPINTHR